MEPKIDSAPKRRRGRPQAFDRLAAVQQAMKLFWENGYEGTSFDALTDAMGISPSSFYNTFGSKEQLYREATDTYLAASGEWFAGALGDDVDAKSAFERLLTTTAREFTRSDLPAGCMVSLAGTHVPTQHMALRDMMAEHRAMAESAMASRLRKGVAAGELPPNTDVRALAAFFNSVARGMAVQARDGASAERLLDIGRIAMQAWPVMQRKRK